MDKITSNLDTLKKLWMTHQNTYVRDKKIKNRKDI